MGTIWKQHPVYDVIEVSDSGRVRLLEDIGHRKAGAILTRSMRGRYLTLPLLWQHRLITLQLHRLVVEAFHGLYPSDEHVAVFLDGNRSNCRADNVQWMTPQHRNQLRYIHGTHTEREARYINGKKCLLCHLCEEWHPESHFPPLAVRRSRHGVIMSKCGRSSECRQCGNKRRVQRRRIAAANGGRSPTLLERILPMMESLDNIISTRADPGPAVGDRIRAARTKVGLSQVRLAKLAKVNAQTIECIERGDNIPRPSTVAKIIRAIQPSRIDTTPRRFAR